jgi:hypothetical protein
MMAAMLLGGRKGVGGSRRPETPQYDFTVELDWRGESAYYIEGDRWVAIRLLGWPHGPPVTHPRHLGIQRRAAEPLTTVERTEVLRRLMDYIKLREGLRCAPRSWRRRSRCDNHHVPRRGRAWRPYRTPHRRTHRCPSSPSSSACICGSDLWPYNLMEPGEGEAHGSRGDRRRANRRSRGTHAEEGDLVVMPFAIRMGPASSATRD